MKICSLHVQGFRSLRDVELPKMDDVTVIFGENNTGKSNILAFLEIVFSRKVPVAAPGTVGLPVVPAGLGPEAATARIGDWMRGEIVDFTDNFFQNSSDRITFSTAVEFSSADIQSILGPGGGIDVGASLDLSGSLTIEGSIIRGVGGTAYMTTERLAWGGKTIYREVEGEEKRFEDVSGLSTDTQDVLLSGIKDVLTDSVGVISSRRFLTEESDDHVPVTDFAPGKFKSTLFNHYMSRDKYKLFAKTASWFAAEPFSYGDITFARASQGTDETLDVMVEKGDLRIPVDRLGSGVQQILVIIANLVATQSKSVFVLEEPEINLSPNSQTELFSRLLALIRENETHVDQLIITSHSPVFGNQRHAKVLHVWHDGTETFVTPDIDVKARQQDYWAWYDSEYFCSDCRLQDVLPSAMMMNSVCPECLSKAFKTREAFEEFTADMLDRNGSA